MRRPWILGTALGLLLALVSVLGNAMHGDPHRLSLFPDMLNWAIQFGLLYATIRIAFRELEPGIEPLRARARGAAVTLGIAGVVYGALATIQAAMVFERPGVLLLALSLFASALVPLGLGGILLAMKYSLALREALAAPRAKA